MSTHADESRQSPQQTLVAEDTGEAGSAGAGEAVRPINTSAAVLTRVRRAIVGVCEARAEHCGKRREEKVLLKCCDTARLLNSQLVPVNPAGQVQVNWLKPLVHVPPF
jgi:hypothetical protein